MRTDRGWSRFYALGWLASALVATVAFRQWQAYVREVERRAEEAEQTREEAARRRAVEERLHIARELHDSLTHSISVIKLQAGVAAHLARKRGEDPPDALLAIQDASADAVRQLRGTLDALREDVPVDGVGIENLASLVQRARASGVRSSLTFEGRPAPAPAEVDQAAYRVVQEALTNVSRHGGSEATASVRVEYGPGTITVRVEDDGAGCTAPPRPGHGLTGMRERVTAQGGSLWTGPRPNGGFAVVAEFPLTGRA
ncbi:sensor histidine kinase [Georgenia alba]|uniref:histidine kinase n=1 Tax=Georgenia alba TaxID=2233858 RepID=A0ABW2QAD6_9MICO